MYERKKEDLRIVRTRLLLKNALIQLLQEKSLEDVSVMDICNKAFVHRATFYKHFEDKYHLFTYTLNCFKQDFAESAQSALQKSPDLLACYLELADKFLTFLQTNKKTALSIIENNKSELTFQIFFDEIEDEIKKYIVNNKSLMLIKHTLPVPMLSTFLCGGLIALAVWWMKNDTVCTKQQLLSYLEMLITYAYGSNKP